MKKSLFPCLLNCSWYLKAGAPMGIPNAFASLLRAITQPSLFERITMGLLPIVVEKHAHKMHKSYYNLLMQTLGKVIKMFAFENLIFTKVLHYSVSYFKIKFV